MKIAVIGTGAAGLSAAWLLSQRHQVTVYEKNRRLGGHAHTVDIPTSRGDVPVDTGFIVYNERNYPNLMALFRHLDVPTHDSDMSFAASLRGGAMEYSGTDLNGLFGQRRNLVRPRFWRMLTDLKRFYDEAPGDLARLDEDISIGAYLRDKRYCDAFIDDHLLPMGAAIWSTTAARMKAYPARAFIRFFESHGLLTLNDRPQWRSVRGGSREYVERISAGFKEAVRFGADIQRIERVDGQVIIHDRAAGSDSFDAVVLACHADEALSLLAAPSEDERRLLGAIRYTRNEAVLHADARLMPQNRRVWASWNFLGLDEGEGDGQALCVSYWMNSLQRLGTDQDVFVTLNPAFEPAAALTYGRYVYHHPLFDTAAMAAQRQLWRLQGEGGIWYCGSYFGYGFHEDAVQSGLRVAEELGGMPRPWRVDGANNRLSLPVTVQAAA